MYAALRDSVQAAFEAAFPTAPAAAFSRGPASEVPQSGGAYVFPSASIGVVLNVSNEGAGKGVASGSRLRSTMEAGVVLVTNRADGEAAADEAHAAFVAAAVGQGLVVSRGQQYADTLAGVEVYASVIALRGAFLISF